MKYKYLALSFIPLLIGSTLFLYFNELIIINFPKTNIQKALIKSAHKKNLNLYFWKNNRWNKENIDILWTSDISQNIYQIINNWLLLIDEEKVINKKVSLQSVLLDGSTLYLSFDNHIFSEDFSTNKKLMLIESMLKTLKPCTDIQSIYFLVHHEIMDDRHLDFANPWPINGFL